MATPRAITALHALLLGGLLLAGCQVSTSTALQPQLTVPAPMLDETSTSADSEVAVLAGGCFWGVQGVFQHVIGVSQAVSGYAGDSRASAEYTRVSSGATSHAESVQITFDPREITYGQLLQIYFSVAH